jgi:lipopolysaccharide/colanic/teichoic acid biosynthesis glycosyltransferase
MELTFLPEQKATKRTYRHFTINATNPAVAEITETSKLEFFYIGRNSAHIDSLINAFDSGYAAESTHNAQSMLKRMLSNPNNLSIPDIIIADAGVGAESLREFRRFLSSHKTLASVPFVVEASSLQPVEIARFRKFDFIDEIIYLKDYTKAALIRKVNFLKKVKHKFVNDNTANRFVETSLQSRYNSHQYVKRSFDIFTSSLLLLALSPLFILIAAAIRMESRGPIFYVAKRAGRGYRIFDFFKFRTMQVGADKKMAEISHLNQYSAEQQGPLFIKIDNDPRITKVGILLRKSSLDELPQLLNVLLGDMSLVGNRPLPLYEAATLTTDEWAKRFMAPAGMTGLWQIKKRGKKEMSVEERIGLDIEYADKYNFLHDLWIMANTPTALFQKTNA